MKSEKLNIIFKFQAVFCANYISFS